MLDWIECRFIFQNGLVSLKGVTGGFVKALRTTTATDAHVMNEDPQFAFLSILLALQSRGSV